MYGVLIIKVVSATLTHDTETFGKMDPYCVLKLGKNTQKTKVHEDGAKNPKWGETFRLQGQIGDIVDFEVWDHEKVVNHDLVGSGSFSISQIFIGKKVEMDYEIKYDKNKKSAGKVFFELEFVVEPKQEGKKEQEEKKETDADVIEKLQAELDEIWAVIEAERKKNNKPQEVSKTKDFSALEKQISQIRLDVMRSKEEVDKYDQESKSIETKFNSFLEEQLAAKQFLEREHSTMSAFRPFFSFFCLNFFQEPLFSLGSFQSKSFPQRSTTRVTNPRY